MNRSSHLTATNSAASMTGMCSMLYNTFSLDGDIQLIFHAEQSRASSMPTENCRQHLHIIGVTHAVISILYFSLILLLDDDQLRWSMVVLSVSQVTANIAGIVTMRMWMYT